MRLGIINCKGRILSWVRPFAWLVFWSLLTALVSTTNVYAQDTAQDQNWQVQCDQENLQDCQIRSTLRTETDRTAARLVIGVIKQDDALLWYINAYMPLGLSIPHGTAFRVDQNPPIILNLQSCDRMFCRASSGLTLADLDHMKKGKLFQLIFTDAKSEKTLGLNFSLIGFTKATRIFEKAIAG